MLSLKRIVFLVCAVSLPCSIFAAESAASDGGISLLDLIVQGGWAMYPLGLLMLALFFLTFHCQAQTRLRRFLRGDGSDAAQRLKEQDLDGGLLRLGGDETVVGRLMRISLRNARFERADFNRAAMDTAFIEAAEGEENAVGQWIQYLNVIATVAPMVGLLGTVSGMIGAFQKIGQGGMGKPDELAGNIGEALITTAAGLVIGIPAMVVYFYFRNRLTNRMLAVGQCGTELLDAVVAGGLRPTPSSSPGSLVEAEAQRVDNRRQEFARTPGQ